MASSDEELVRRTAELARLSITADEAALLAPQFARILEHFRTLSEVDLEGVEPTTGAFGLRDVLRPDEPRESLSQDAALSNAPERIEDFYSVPKTIGGDS
jgi:aspartyl-tRNA(Asn)/glutamyl-tRNA(Gln) amidotransferase subunit C